MRKNKKVSDTSIRVMETLKFLTKNNSSIQDIIKHFEKIDPNNRIYTNEVILKYINTLKVFGFKFEKEKDKYILVSTPVQFDFNRNELRTISLIENCSSLFPDEQLKQGINEFLQDIEKRFSQNTKILADNIKKQSNADFHFNYLKYSDKIKEYEKYCIEGLRLKITFTNKDKIKTSIMVEPNEIKYFQNNVYLHVYNPISAEFQDINFKSIINVEQLPLKVNQTKMVTSVTFELKDRLAKAYKIHEGEKLLQIKSNGNIVIQNQKEDRTLLLKRLMRYGENCEVITPQNLREEMINLIKATLANYK